MLGPKIYKNFIAYSYEDLLEELERVFKKLRYDYKGGQGKPSVVLGSKDHSYIFYVYPKNGDKITFRVIEAVADPVTKVATYLNDSRKYFRGACLLHVSPYNAENKKVIKKIFNEVEKQDNKEFWDLKAHPRFRLAVLLRFRVKSNWVQVLNGK